MDVAETVRSDAAQGGRAFDVPGFRWLWLGSMLTWTGWLVSTLTHGWLMLQLTDSPFWVGMGVGVRGAAQAIGSLPGGALADRVDRRRLLLATQSATAALTLAMGVIVLTGGVQVWHVLIFMAATGALAAVDRPATSGLYYDLVGPHRLMNASAARFIGQSATNVVASLAGGAVLQWLGIGQNFLFVFGLHLVSLLAFVALRAPATVTNLVGPLTRGIAQGLDYAMRTPPVRRLLGLSLIMETFGFASMTMMPVIARDVLHIGAIGLGYLTAMGGVGQLAAALRLIVRRDAPPAVGELLASAAGFGVLIAVFGASSWVLLSLALAPIVFACAITYDVTMFALLPRLTSDEMRGRVLGLFAATLGFSQLGGLFAGSTAAILGAPAAMIINGVLAATGVAWLRRGIRDAVPDVGQSTDIPPSTTSA